jgi:Holliday junction resolvase
MINFNEEDKKYIDSNKGTYSARGVSDVLSTIEEKFGKEKKEEFKRAMQEAGYNVFFEGKESKTIPLVTFIALIVGEKYFFEIEEEEVKEIGKESAKLSFLLKFASKLLASLDMLVKNANEGWRKYYNTGELFIVEYNKEEKKIIGEVRDFLGHPLHCKHIEGYFEQIIFFVTGKKITCHEEECVFRGGKVHRYIMRWE